MPNYVIQISSDDPDLLDHLRNVIELHIADGDIPEGARGEATGYLADDDFKPTQMFASASWDTTDEGA